MRGTEAGKLSLDGGIARASEFEGSLVVPAPQLNEGRCAPEVEDGEVEVRVGVTRIELDGPA
jgi:hypothetical protein